MPLKDLLPIAGAVAGGIISGSPMGALAGFQIAGRVTGSLMQADAQKQAARASWEAANYNAATAEKNAEFALFQAAEDERKFRISVYKDQGANRAAIGAAGITVSGSALDVLEQNARDSEIDALQIRHEGNIRAYSFRREAELLRMEGSSALSAGKRSATATLIGGIAEAGGQLAVGLDRGFFSKAKGINETMTGYRDINQSTLSRIGRTA